MINDRFQKFEVARERLDSVAGNMVNTNSDKLYLNANNSVMAEKLLSVYLNNCFYVNESAYSTASDLIDHFHGLAELRYPDEKYFIEAVHKKGADFKKMVGFDEGNSINPICITGRSGDGKTKLMEFLYGLFDGCDSSIENQLGTFGNLGWDTFSAERCTSARSIVAKTRLAQDGFEIGDYGKLCYANGVVGFGVDELQFTTKSKAANSQVTTLLLNLRSLSVPWLYACNYSLLWKLLQRNQEDLARIVPKIINFSSFSNNSLDDQGSATIFTERLLKEIEELMPSNYEKMLTMLPQLSGMSPRYLRDLLSLANRIRFDDNKPSICLDSIEKAFCSTEFAIQRANIEMINNGTDYLVKKRKYDLVIPPELSSVNDLSRRDNLHVDRYKILVASLTRDEKKQFRNTKEGLHSDVQTLQDISKKDRMLASYDILKAL